MKLFQEIQRMTLVTVAFLAIAIGFGISCIIQIGFNIPIGNNPASNSLLLAIFIISLLGIIFIYFQKLILLVTEKDIQFSYGILTGERIVNIHNIERISIRRYDALKEFGGWGVRFNDNQRCLTVNGNIGIELQLKGGEKLLIGTKQPQGFSAVMTKLSAEYGFTFANNI